MCACAIVSSVELLGLPISNTAPAIIHTLVETFEKYLSDSFGQLCFQTSKTHSPKLQFLIFREFQSVQLSSTTPSKSRRTIRSSSWSSPCWGCTRVSPPRKVRLRRNGLQSRSKPALSAIEWSTDEGIVKLVYDLYGLSPEEILIAES